MLFQTMYALLFIGFIKLVFSSELFEPVIKDDDSKISLYIRDPTKLDLLLEFFEGEQRYLNDDLCDIEEKQDEIEKSAANTFDDSYKQRMDFIKQRFFEVDKRVENLDFLFSQVHDNLKKYPESENSFSEGAISRLHGNQEEFEELKVATERLKQHIDVYKKRKEGSEHKALEK